MPNYLLKSPETNQEWEAYLLFRWEVLRKPLGMSKESLADSIEDESFHLMGVDDQNRVIASGRVHFNSSEEAQIRYMAVDDNFKRKVPGRNNHNAPKLIEKYNDLAREASSNGDKILSENYLQHADHFTRILNEQENYKRLKFAENKSAENTTETQELSEKTEEISTEDKKVVAEIKPISKKKN